MYKVLVYDKEIKQWHVVFYYQNYNEACRKWLELRNNKEITIIEFV